MSFIGFVKQDG
jgi:hypothetical protein